MTRSATPTPGATAGRRSHRRRQRAAWKVTATAAACSLMAACHQSEEPQPPGDGRFTLSGVVADGPLQGVTVCYDLNDNLACDADEPTSAPSDADGRFNLQVTRPEAGRHAAIALVPATAVDKDTGGTIGAALALRAPPSGANGDQTVFISALSTAVDQLARSQGLSTAEAEAQVRSALGLSGSALADFTAAGGSADAALAARALTTLLVQVTQQADAASLPAGQRDALLNLALTSQLDTVGQSLAGSGTDGSTAAARAALAVTAARTQMGLGADNVQQVADALVPADVVAPDADGPFVVLRRMAHASANQYSYTVFTGDTTQVDANGETKAHEVRKAISDGADQPFNRNQLYWTGTEWRACPQQWEVVTAIRRHDEGLRQRQTSTYCGASRSASSSTWRDIGGKTLREVVASIRAYPLPDSTGAHTDTAGLPVRWGPDPALLPADLRFPAGSRRVVREQTADIGGTDRIDLAGRQNVRRADGRFRQPTTLEQYGSMPGDLTNAGVTISTANTVFVADQPMASQPDATLGAWKRWRAGFDITNLKLRFYMCDNRLSDNASINCVARGDGTLAISTQGGSRLLRVVSGYPAVLTEQLRSQRFWAEHSGTVLRGSTDLQTLRHDQRLNGVAWQALRTALGIPAHTEPTAPVERGPATHLRDFSFTNADNYRWRLLSGNDAVVDANNQYLVNEQWRIVSDGTVQPYARNTLYWTGSTWYDCPSDGVGVALASAAAPFQSVYCSAYKDDRVSRTVQVLDGRRMSDVVTDIRSYGSLDGTVDPATWGPNPASNPALANAFFPAGSTLILQGTVRRESPLAIAADQVVRLPPVGNDNPPFNTWPVAGTLEQLIAGWAGDLLVPGTALNGQRALGVRTDQLPSAPAPQYNTTVDIRVAFDANGQRARFYRNYRLASNGATTAYVVLLDTTYAIETVGDARVLKFAAMPSGFEDEHDYQTLLVERGGTVWYGFKSTVSGRTQWSQRLNGTAFDALKAALGIAD